jgi:Cu(I)/Ag(I) efflux system membrane fusion protein
MWFVFDAYERDLAWLKPGQPVEVTTPAVPGQTFTGAVAFVDPNLKEMTRSAKARVELPNPIVDVDGRPRRRLYHKLYADALVRVEFPEALTISRTAVLSPGSQPLVYVDRGGGAYEQRLLRLGRAGDELWEVLEGLSPGERVVTTGNLLIDAQAQLNANASQMPAGHDHPGSPEQPATTSTQPGLQPAGAGNPLPALDEGQRKAVLDFLQMVAALADALAGDDLARFNTEAARTHQLTPALISRFERGGPFDKSRAGSWASLVQKAESVGHLTDAAELKAARKEFHPLSELAAELGKSLRRQDPAFNSLRIFRCPMTKDSFPGAPRTAEWIQWSAPIRNPYFGAEMLDCGSEVK